MNDATRLLKAIADGNPQAADQLLPLVYTELRRLAAAKLVRRSPVRLSMPPGSSMKRICGL